MAEKYIRLVQDMYRNNMTTVRSAAGMTKGFTVKVGLYQGLALSPFLFAIVIDRLTDEVRQETLWTMLFADDIVICNETKQQAEDNLERWRYVLEHREIKVSRNKTEYIYI